jgi:hypothetical protein
MHCDGRAVISDFELAVNANDSNEPEISSRLTKEDESVYVSPEVCEALTRSSLLDSFSS